MATVPGGVSCVTLSSPIMRTVLRPSIAVAALLAIAVVAPLASAASTATVPTRRIPATGGTIKWAVMVHAVKTCTWSSSPKVAGFDGTVRCLDGREIRPATFLANTSTDAKDYMLNLVVRGTTTTVDHLKVVEVGKSAPSTTTTSVTTTTLPSTGTSTTTSTTTTTLPSTGTGTTTSTTTTTLPATSFPGLTSNNWSGYVLTGATGGYEAISASWTVPTLDCSSVPGGFTSDWVGVNGAGDQPGLFQDGTSSYCLNGQESSYAWWTDEAEGYSGAFLFAVASGDVIDAKAYRDPSDYWNYSVDDVTSGSSNSAPEIDSGPGTSAEWIAEDPEDPTTNALYPLADFGSVTFADLGLLLQSGSWTLPPYSDAYEMVTPGGSVEALPSPMEGSSSSAAFTVTYEASGEMDSMAVLGAVKHAQSTFVWPVARVLRQSRTR